VSDPVKGEALVMLTTEAVKIDELRARLLDAGLPNLWVPKIIQRVENIPMLGSGKLDLKACRQLAESSRA
jgi:acyl-[acyl-carrier-protein]-phospholipid O-acyltransferase/long-chain-fatty-acid--[acyl-carrier-protein] ligase